MTAANNDEVAQLRRRVDDLLDELHFPLGSNVLLQQTGTAMAAEVSQLRSQLRMAERDRCDAHRRYLAALAALTDL